MQVRADAIARRYEGERRLMEAVARGDMRAADMVEETTLRLERVPNKLRNRKNLFIVLNNADAQCCGGRAGASVLYRRNQRQMGHAHRGGGAGGRPLSHAAGDRGGLLSSGADAFHGQLFPQCAKHAHLCAIQFGRGLSLEAIARQLGVNASYLSSQFNREVGKSLPEYVSEKRIAEAKRLLRGRAQLPIGQIAAAVGFSDVNYFTKVFKKKAGQTPSAYRAAQRALAAEQKEI